PRPRPFPYTTRFRSQLRFPGARVLWMDAARLASERLYDGAPVGAVVSGLPLLNMSPRKVISIVGGAFSYMRPGAAFYQFTYGMRSAEHTSELQSRFD